MNKLVRLLDKSIPDYYVKEPDSKAEVPHITLQEAQDLIDDSDLDGDGLLN